MSKIVFISSTWFAAKSFLKPHLDYLSSRHEITLVCGDYFPSASEDIPGVKIIHLEIRRRPSHRDLISFLFCFQLIKKINPDLVVTITPKLSLIAALLRIVCPDKIKFLHYFTGQVWAGFEGLKLYLFKEIDKFVIKTIDHSICDGTGQKQFLVDQGVCSFDRIDVIGYGSVAGVDLSTSVKRCRSDASIVRIVFIGRLCKDKGVDDLMVVFFRLIESKVKFKLTVVGPDEGGFALRLNRISKDFPSCFRYIGPVDDVSPILPESDILLLPSRREGFGSVVIEAAAHSVPVVGYNIYGLSGTVINGRTGFLCDPFDVEGYSKLVVSLCLNHGRIQTVGDNARLFVADRFSRSLVITNFERYISNILDLSTVARSRQVER